MKRVFLLVGVAAISLFFFTSSNAFAVDGWAAMNEGTTGGQGGTIVTVDSNAVDFKAYVESTSTYIVQVLGTIDLVSVGGGVNIRSNKTIKGLNSSSTIKGKLGFENGSSNIIIEHLNIHNPSYTSELDGISVKNAITNLFITKCTIYDCGDGCIDITNQSDYVTVSWCKFYYDTVTSHCLVNLIGSSDNPTNPDTGKLNCTFHHNWWSTDCDQRMPRVRFGKVHVYNNYYSCSGNSYCIGVGDNSQIRVEDNYFDNVNYLWKNYSDAGNPGSIGWNSTNVYAGSSTEPTWASNDYTTIFTPPYSYTLDAGVDVKSIVMDGAGNIGGDYPPAAPENLVATPGDGTVSLEWDDNSEPDLEGYNVYRSTTSGSPYDGSLNGSLLIDPNYYTDNSVTNGTTYYYVVTAVDTNDLESDYSNEDSATPGDSTPPLAPTGLSATAGDRMVWLDWNDNSEGDLDGYNVYRSTTPGGYSSPLNGLLLSSSDYTDNSVTNGTTYYYVVTAVDTSSNESGYSSEVSASPSSAPGAMGTILREWWTGIPGSSVSDLNSEPDFPDNPTGSNQLASLEAPTDWADSYGTRISGYLHPPTSGDYTFWIASDDNSELWLSTDGDPENASMIANVSGYTNPREWDKYSAQESDPIYLAASQKYYIEVLHKENSSSDNLAVAWQGPGISQQVIYGTYLSPWFIGLYGDSTGNDIVDMNDLPDFMAVWVEDDCAESSAWDLDGDCIINLYEFSVLAGNWLKVLPDTNAPSAPTNLTAAAGDGTVSLEWDDNSEPDLEGYNVYRSTTSGSPYDGPLNGSLLIDPNYYTDNSVTNGTTYYYVVKAVDTSLNESGYSNEASATPSEPVTSITIQENETSFCNVDGSIDNDNAGYTGDGFANTNNASGNGIDYKVNILTAGTYTFIWRYAHGKTEDRTARLLVNGSEKASSIAFPPTGDWTSWSTTSSVDVTLSTGIKDIRLEATAAATEGLANIDYMEVTGPNLQAASCPP